MFHPLPDNFHALITGTSGAIGSAFARQLRTKYPHARLSMLDVDPAKSAALARQLGGETHVVAADLSRLETIPTSHSTATEKFGHVQLLVNCAGIMDVRSVEAMPWEIGERVMTIDLLAPMRLTSLCVPDMVRAGGGAIINVSSMAGRVPLKGCGYYGAAKAGLAMTTDIARAELADKNVRVIGIYPGAIHSDLERGARNQYPDSARARAMPSGDPAELARRMLRALERNEREVIYPEFYKIASVFGGMVGLAPRLSARLSPAPKV